ncbi:histidine phosphatase family protein [Aerococcaceae bacterium WGS1372]
MAITFVRHGETEANKLRKYYGKTDLPLNMTGMNQMRAVARQLEAYDCNLIIHSGLTRARQSAEIIMNENCLSNIEIELNNNYNERDFGSWEMLDANQIKSLYPEDWNNFINDPFNTTPLKAESYKAFQNRVNTEFQLLIDELKSTDSILFVGHGGVIREIIANFFAKDINYWDIRVECGRVYRYELG